MADDMGDRIKEAQAWRSPREAYAAGRHDAVQGLRHISGEIPFPGNYVDGYRSARDRVTDVVLTFDVTYQLRADEDVAEVAQAIGAVLLDQDGVVAVSGPIPKEVRP